MKILSSKALSRAHARGIVHRDIKPDNVFLCDAHEGEIFVKVLDFGIAKRAEQETGGTQTGQALGTPSFMSPEQTLGSKDVDHRSDLWSLGVLAFLLLTGTKPFPGGSVGAVAIAVHTKAHPKPTERNPQLPLSVDAWFAKACAIEAEDRFQSAREMADALAESLEISITLSRSLSGEHPYLTRIATDSAPPQETNPGPLAHSIQPETIPVPAPRKKKPRALLFAGAAVLAVASFGALRAFDRSPVKAPGEEAATHAAPAPLLPAAPAALAPPADAPDAAPSLRAASPSGIQGTASAENARPALTAGAPPSEAPAAVPVEPAKSGGEARGHGKLRPASRSEDSARPKTNYDDIE